jgi:hypothetical protein
MLLRVDSLVRIMSLTSRLIESGRIPSVIIGGWNPYNVWKGVILSDLWNEVLYHHSAIER